MNTARRWELNSYWMNSLCGNTCLQVEGLPPFWQNQKWAEPPLGRSCGCFLPRQRGIQLLPGGWLWIHTLSERARCTRSGVLKHSVQSRTASQGPSVVKGLRNVPSSPTARACAVQRGPSVVRHSPRLLSRRGRCFLSCSEPAAASLVPRLCLVRAGRPRPLALLGAVCLITP